MKKRVKVSAPGKVILSGEHSVVYGYPAILAAIDKRATVELAGTISGTNGKVLTDLAKYRLDKVVKKLSENFSFSIKSDIPSGSGLGSSAALSVAISAAVTKITGQKWDPEKINEIAYQMEKKHHGNPSGGDNTISTYGGLLWYRKEAEGLKLFKSITPKKRLPKLFLLDTGSPSESTKDMVELVATSRQKNQKRMDKIMIQIELITKKFLHYLLNEKRAMLSELIVENQRLLEELGVVSSSTKALIRKIEKIGGAAKITGAGGVKAGSGMLIVYHPNHQKLLNLAKTNRLATLAIKLGEKGVQTQ